MLDERGQETTMTHLTLEEIDRDGAFCEAVERVGGTRADVLRKATIGSMALLGALALPADAEPATPHEIDFLNFGLTLEYLQAAFYTDAEMMGKLRGKAERAARLIGATERAHVAAYREMLGPKAVKRPRFNFRGTTEAREPFARTGIALEDLAVAAYKAQLPHLRSKALLASALSIHTVEARHAAWMRRMFGVVPVKDAFARPQAKAEILRTVASTGFAARKPTMAAKQEPRFTG
jgi:ferritin-like protein